MENNEATDIIDNDRLRWISFFHYVSGGITIAFSLFFLIYAAIFGFIAFNPEVASKAQHANPKQTLEVIRILVFVFGTFSTIGILLGISEILSGTFIRKRKYRVFSMVIAVLRVLNIPYGTILSIFTLIMLSRESVKEQYQNSKDNRNAVHNLDA